MVTRGLLAKEKILCAPRVVGKDRRILKSMPVWGSKRKNPQMENKTK